MLTKIPATEGSMMSRKKSKFLQFSHRYGRSLLTLDECSFSNLCDRRTAIKLWNKFKKDYPHLIRFINLSFRKVR